MAACHAGNVNVSAIREHLRTWYQQAHRKLPWRETRDPYTILVSEVMLQQTRVATALPYYERFLRRFPTIAALAEAPEQDVLAHWAGLGYYYRARNLQEAARRIVADGAFPSTYDNIRALPGVGDYTAAAVASISFGLPHAVVDGNVLRVISRLANDAGDIAATATKKRFQRLANDLLDHADPATHNQAVMEHGATLCTPRNPQCLLCPVAPWCAARAAGTQDKLPVKGKKAVTIEEQRTLLLVEQDGLLLLRLRPPDSRLMPGFYELPEERKLPGARLGTPVGQFRHGQTITRYTFRVVRAEVEEIPGNCHWIDRNQLDSLPVSTVTRKALRLVME